MNIEKVFQPIESGNFFFGYYDKSQISICGQYALSHKINFLDRYPNFNELSDVGYFKLLDNKFVPIEKTSAINYQQGSMLNWHSHNNIIFNQLKDHNYRSTLIDMNGKIIENIEAPIYSLAENKKFFLTINFYNLSKFKRGYGYDYNFDVNFKNYYHKPDEVGIWIYNFDKKKIIKLISSNEIHKDNECWIEHISISPDNFNYIFLLRYKLKDGGIRDKVFLSDTKKTKLIEIKTFSRGSHYNWIDKNSFIIYGGINNLLNKIRHNKYFQKIKYFKNLLKLYHKTVSHNSKISKIITGDSYYIYNINSNDLIKLEAKFNLEDGHPSVDKINKNILITDHYADIENNKLPKLYIYDLINFKMIRELEFDSISQLDNSGYRCDLHPRFASNSHVFSIDIFENSRRTFQVYKISNY